MTAALPQNANVLRKSRPRIERRISSPPVIGKDILELLSSAMYLDPRAIFREYIQNAADAIDDAVRSGSLVGDVPGRVDVHLDPIARTIRIRDNGTGVPAVDAERVLTSFGASAKRGRAARGFRGVGRLSAFGYAQQVVFRTKAAGDRTTTEVRWDCRRLKSALLDRSYAGDLRQLVDDVVTVIVEDVADVDAHFFEVTLERVVRTKNDVLLNGDEIRSYLGEVAPAPFDASFALGGVIADHLRAHLPPCHFRTFLNDASEPISRPHSTQFAVTTAKQDEVTEVECVTIPDGNGGLAAVGWLLHHSYLGAIHASPQLRGIRARVGDVQIGTGDLFVDAFHDPRFNSWTIGEIHIVDPRVIPNGRRDGFEQNNAFANLSGELAVIARRQASRCRQSSARRNRRRAIETRYQKIEEHLAALSQHSLTKTRAARIRREIGSMFAEMKRLSQSSVLAEDERRWARRRVISLEGQVEGLKTVGEQADPFADRPAAQRALYSQMLDLIYDCSTSKTAARILADKIVARLTAQQISVSKKRTKPRTAKPAKAVAQPRSTPKKRRA